MSVEKSKELAIGLILCRSAKRVAKGQIPFYDLAHDFSRSFLFGKRARTLTEHILIHHDIFERQRFCDLAEIAALMCNLGPEGFSRFWGRQIAKCETLTEYEIEICRKALEMRTMSDEKFVEELETLSKVERAIVFGVRFARQMNGDNPENQIGSQPIFG